MPFAGIGYDLGVSYSRTQNRQHTPDVFINKLQNALNGFGGPNCTGTVAGAGGCVYFNPFSNGYSGNPALGLTNPGFVSANANSPALIDWLFERGSETRQIQDLFVVDLVFNGELPIELPGGNIGWAAGGQYRTTDFQSILRSPFQDVRVTPCPVPGTTNCALPTGPYIFLGQGTPVQLEDSVYAFFAETNLPITDVAFAAGFQSVRQFNETVRDVYAASPTALRAAKSPNPAGGPLTVRLACREPFDGDALFGFLAARAVPGVESVDGDTYRRSLRLARGLGVVSIAVHGSTVTCALHLDDLADAQAAVQRTRRLLDLDCDPATVRGHLGSHPLLAELLVKRPGLRAPGHPDGAELLVRAVMGQQISVAGARTLAARLVAAHGEPLAAVVGGVTHAFPSAATIAGLSPHEFAMPRARGAALIDACAKVADGTIVLDAGSDRAEARLALETVKGIGPWTAGYVAMRALGDPDVFLPTDVGVRHALAALGADPTPRGAIALAEAWRPWRSYALHHLWASL